MKVDVVKFFSDHVFQGLRAAHGTAHPILQVDAIRFLLTFRSQVPCLVAHQRSTIDDVPPTPSLGLASSLPTGIRILCLCAACPRPTSSVHPSALPLAFPRFLLLSPPSPVHRTTHPSPNPARLSRVDMAPGRPTIAHLIHTARSYSHAYRLSSVTTTSLYTQHTSSTRLDGTRSRTSFYSGPTDDTRAWGRIRDTFPTVTTSDTDTVCTVPHLFRAVAETSPFADPDLEQPASSVWQSTTSVGTSLGLQLRLSYASEHARYRLRERECQREREFAE